MPDTLLDSLKVLDLGDDPAARAARALGDLGAEVVRVVPAAGDPLSGNIARAWNTGKRLASESELDDLLAWADIVFDTPHARGVLVVDPARAQGAVWVSITPFGLTGPRATWRASDLGVMAASGNMYQTGDPDRAPVRCTEPTAYAHSGPEAAFAALTALWTGTPQRVDVSMQEVVSIANMAAAGRFGQTGFRGTRRGANIGRTREIWPTRDGFVSFGLRGGKARIPSLTLISQLAGLPERDWSDWNPNTADEAVLREIEDAVAKYFAAHTMQELYDIACETNLMLAPANSPREIYQSAQLAARNFFTTETPRRPRTFATIQFGANAPLQGGSDSKPVGEKAWGGLRILEFGSGAAGPIATRYFAEHGATVLRVESKSRPDFLRVYSLGPDNPHGLEGSGMYDGLNVGKRNLTLNLKHPDAVALVRRLVVEWADAVAENFAPRAMKGFGLDYEALAELRPDLVMISACLNGQTGPHKDYPGFGGQGSALGGYNALTGWPDREPIGPHGTITDSLAPRFVATALAAALHHRRSTGQGAYIDIAQVETAIWSLTPWLLDYEVDGVLRVRQGNDHAGAIVHGAYPCADADGIPDRWVTIACWTAEEAGKLDAISGGDIETWTRARTPLAAAQELQAAGIEAVPVQDLGDVYADPQLAHRGHFERHVHPFMGEGAYERNGFRLSAAPSGYDAAGPTLGQDNDWVLRDVLGLDDAAIGALIEAGAVE